MKKLICALLICALCACALSGCGQRESAPQDAPSREGPEVTSVPEEGAHGETDQSAALRDMPTLEPVQAADAENGSDEYYSIDALIAGAGNGNDEDDDLYDGPDEEDDDVPDAQTVGEDGASATPVPISGTSAVRVINPSEYQYSSLVDTTLGFTFNYPAHWKNIPGVYTICYREDRQDGTFPARVAITAKRLVHSPEGTVLSDELTSYVKAIYKQYEPDTFQTGTPNTEDEFMGQQAYSNTYLAYSGETEVKGFIIGRAVKRVLYVFHFCAAYEDYQALEGVMRYMLNSVELVGEE